MVGAQCGEWPFTGGMGTRDGLSAGAGGQGQSDIPRFRGRGSQGRMQEMPWGPWGGTGVGVAGGGEEGSEPDILGDLGLRCPDPHGPHSQPKEELVGWAPARRSCPEGNGGVLGDTVTAVGVEGQAVGARLGHQRRWREGVSLSARALTRLGPSGSELSSSPLLSFHQQHSRPGPARPAATHLPARSPIPLQHLGSCMLLMRTPGVCRG